MHFTVRNQVNIANNYLRFAKWKIYKISRKLGEIIYAEIFANKISHKYAFYDVTIKMGVPKPDIIVSAGSNNLNELWSTLSLKMKRQSKKKEVK